jgi:hypothetical protein
MGNNHPEKRKAIVFRALTTAPLSAERVRVVEVAEPVPVTVETTCDVHEAGMLRLFNEGWQRFEEVSKSFGDLKGAGTAPVDFSVVGGDGHGNFVPAQVSRDTACVCVCVCARVVCLRV